MTKGKNFNTHEDDYFCYASYIQQLKINYKRMKRKCLFIDRDGTLVKEPLDEQVDALDKIRFVPGVFTYLSKIAKQLDYKLVLVSNQDGLGTESFPENAFWPSHNFIIEALKGEDIIFADQLIDRSFPNENKVTRKPGIGMFGDYVNSDKYDIPNSFVIGDRETDMELAEKLGCKGLGIGGEFLSNVAIPLQGWKEIFEYLIVIQRTAVVIRNTRETKIRLNLAIDGFGKSDISTGIGFFDHMLEQISRHAGVDIVLNVEGDLDVDEHHTIEDTGLVLGEAFRIALGKKRGINRYGFELPMDDSKAKVLIDFGGRPWFIWDAEFKRELIGKMPTELFSHFFKSFSDAAQCNLQIEASGENEHHKIEAIFKAFSRAIRMAVIRGDNQQVPSTKDFQ